VEEAATLAAHSRFGNAGQSCIAAKRLIVEQSVADRFVEALVARVDALVPGDPLAESTTIGPMARVDLAENLERQVRESCLKGAVVLRGGHRRNAWFEPTVLTNVQPGMAAFEEETFGPLACISVAENNAAAMELAMQTRYGLGITVCTTSVAAAEAYAARVSDGAFFVNQFVKSDPRLPFGGTGISGYGRELSSQGLLEFTNTKTVYIR
jgi:succinate-semialdehyde dehydrogenase/glutarate-semialdehyde dehydrogenase